MLHVGLSHVAEWIVEGRLRARVRAGEERPSVWSVDVCEADVRVWRDEGRVRPCPVVDRVADEVRAQWLLRRRRASSGWLVGWSASRRPGGRPSTRRMGVTVADRCREVRVVVSVLGGRSGWVRVAGVVAKMGNRGWVTAGSVRDVVDILVGEGVVELRVFRPRMGRPSLEVRFVKKES